MTSIYVALIIYLVILFAVGIYYSRMQLSATFSLREKALALSRQR